MSTCFYDTNLTDAAWAWVSFGSAKAEVGTW